VEAINNYSASVRLDDRVAVVTGGASGIGQSIAQRFAVHGASVRIVDIDLGRAEATVSQIVRDGGRATAHVCNVAYQAEVRTVFKNIVQHERIDILVNSVGIPHVGNLENTSEADFDKIFQINVKGMYNCLQAAVPHMKSNGGVILNIASIAGSSGLSDRFAYSMSKGAVIAMTYSVAKDYIQQKIRCNCISPARVHTPFVDDYLRRNYPGREKEMFEQLARSAPIGRMAEPHEVASFALFLCSDQTSFLTGVDFPFDGGFFNLRG
jgi:2-keto-3-deoxy-L-fuconate dehydrogenase